MSSEAWRDRTFLDRMALLADDPADRVAAELFSSGETWQFVTHLKDLSQMSGDAGVPDAVRAFLEAHDRLPDWADEGRLRRAEQLFDDHAVLAVTALFCASLPECYVVGDEAAVLHRTAQLEDKTLYRVRQTGRFIFSVMADHGLDGRPPTPDATWVSGRLQILVVRLIHAIVRHLIEKGPSDPSLAGGASGDASGAGAAGAGATGAGSQSEWMGAFCPDGASPRGATDRPINQLQLAYTLLTFSYVIVRSLRRLGVRWSRQEVEDYFFTWNVVGHVLGVRDDLMVWNYEDAEAFFSQMKERIGPTTPAGVHLTERLIEAMETTLRWNVLRSLPAAVMHVMLGTRTAEALGVPTKQESLGRAIVFRTIRSTLVGIGNVSERLDRSIPLARWVHGQIAQGFVTHLLRTETRTYYAPLRLRNGPENRPGMISRMLFRPPRAE